MGGINRWCAGWVPVQAILMLGHGPEVELCRLDMDEAFRSFLCQLFAPTSLDSDAVKQKHWLKKQVDFCACVLERVPIYTLNSRSDGSFWPAVEAL